jgi:hypothetical protein
MYWNEKDHTVAHFHAFHAGRRASVSVERPCWQGPGAPRSAVRQGMGWASPRGDRGKLDPRPQKRAPPRYPAPALELLIMSETYLPVVTGVAVIGDHRLRLLFSDGTVGDVDLSAQRWTGVLEPQRPGLLQSGHRGHPVRHRRLAGQHRPGTRATLRAGARPPACRRLTHLGGRHAAGHGWTRSTATSAVASHAIGCADSRPGIRSPGSGGCAENGGEESCQVWWHMRESARLVPELAVA